MRFVSPDRQNPRQCVRVSASNQPEDVMYWDLCSEQCVLFYLKANVSTPSSCCSRWRPRWSVCPPPPSPEMWVSEDVCYIGATVGVSLWRKKCLRARINCGIKVSPHGSRLTGSISADFGGRHCQDLDALPDTRVFLQANVLLSEKIGWDDLFPYGLHAFSQPPPPHTRCCSISLARDRQQTNVASNTSCFMRRVNGGGGGELSLNFLTSTISLSHSFWRAFSIDLLQESPLEDLHLQAEHIGLMQPVCIWRLLNCVQGGFFFYFFPLLVGIL